MERKTPLSHRIVRISQRSQLTPHDGIRYRERVAPQKIDVPFMHEG